MIRRLIVRITRALACGALWAALPAAGADDHAAHAGQDAPPDPPPALRDHYAKDAARIRELRAMAADPAAPPDARLQAFKTLRAGYALAATDLAASLVGDKVDQVASLAIDLTIGAAVMSDHTMAQGQSMTPAAHAIMARHERANQALRAAVADPRPAIRNRAAATLASLSDREGLDAIQRAASSGAYTELAAANYFGLAKPDVAGDYLVKYLGNGSPEVQTAAVAYLGALPKYESQVRDKYLLNADAPLEARMAAARTLGRDATNIVPLLINPEIPAELFSTTVKTYIDAKGAKFTPADVKSLSDSVKAYQKSKPAADLKEVHTALQTLEKSKTQ